MIIAIQGFDWDEGNRTKCSSHGLSIDAIEDLFNGDIRIVADDAHSMSERRYVGVGRLANGRCVFVGFTFRTRDGRVLIRPITARFMRAKEMRRYEKETPEV